MKLKIKKKAIKSLTLSQDLPVAQTPQVAGGIRFPETRVDKGCPWFTHIQVNTCPNPY